MGVGQNFETTVYVYDREKIIQTIMNKMPCDYKMALCFFEENINKDYGKRGPIFFCRIDDVVNIV